VADVAVRWLADVRVELRAGIADPEGQTIADGLRALGYDTVDQVRSGKLLRIAFEADAHEQADALVGEMCRRLLANPVMETARWELVADAEQDADEAVPS
jgi:phosphoribosylformylglycinamidine synthase PurS subunit